MGAQEGAALPCAWLQFSMGGARPGAPPCALREARLIWVSAYRMTRGAGGAAGRARARFLATVSSVHCNKNWQMWRERNFLKN